MIIEFLSPRGLTNFFENLSSLKQKVYRGKKYLEITPTLKIQMLVHKIFFLNDTSAEQYCIFKNTFQLFLTFFQSTQNF